VIHLRPTGERTSWPLTTSAIAAATGAVFEPREGDSSTARVVCKPKDLATVRTKVDLAPVPSKESRYLDFAVHADNVQFLLAVRANRIDVVAFLNFHHVVSLALIAMSVPHQHSRRVPAGEATFPGSTDYLSRPRSI